MVELDQLSLNVPSAEYDAFKSFTREKWGSTRTYLRVEIEQAMMEYLDEGDYLADAEHLLRKHTRLQESSSSTVQVCGTAQYRDQDTTKVGVRVNADIFERFKAFVDEHTDARSYGVALARAMNAYRGGGRARRVLERVKDLVTSGTTVGSTDDSVEGSDGKHSREQTSSSTEPAIGTNNGSGDVEVNPRIVLDIIDDLPESLRTGPLPKQQIRNRLAFMANNENGFESDQITPENLKDAMQVYPDAVADQLALVDHPWDEKDVYLSESQRDEVLYWEDMNKEIRVTMLRRFVVASAFEHEKMDLKIKREAVTKIFERFCDGGPSHTYALELMRGAADGTPGITMDDSGKAYKLNVKLDEVPKHLIQWVDEEMTEISIDTLEYDARITDYAAGSAPEQEVDADD